GAGRTSGPSSPAGRRSAAPNRRRPDAPSASLPAPTLPVRRGPLRRLSVVGVGSRHKAPSRPFPPFPPGGPGDPGEVAVETIGNWYWIVDEIEAAGCVPKLVHARKAKLMMGEINKTDKLDARGLNRLQQAGTLPTVWIPPVNRYLKWAFVEAANAICLTRGRMS